MQPGRFYGVGLGPGDPELITLKALKALQSCGTVFTAVSAHAEDSVSEGIVRALGVRARLVRLVFSMSMSEQVRQRQLEENAAAMAAELGKGRDCAFAVLGDSLAYATCGHVLPLLKKALPGLVCEIVPGVTSWSALAARAGRVLAERGEELRIVPSFTRDAADRLELEPGTATVLLKTYRTRAALTARLRREEGVEVLYGERVGLKGEFLSSSLDEVDERPETYLSLMLARKRPSKP